MSAHVDAIDARPAHRDLGLVELAFSLAIIGGIVYAVAGLPRMPSSLPSIPANLDIQLELLVRSPTAEQLGVAVQLLEWAFWLGWAFVVATVLLRIVVVLAMRVADGAAWVRSLRWLSDLLTLPFIRRAVDSSMAGAILLRVTFVTPSALVAYAAPIAAQVSPAGGPTAAPAAAASTRVTTPDHLPADMQPGDVLHVVRYGETLISISQTYFGDEDHWKQIYADNRHRPQPHHGSFDDAGKIYKDWVLVIHRPSQIVEYDADGTAWHTARQGETLWGICEAVYGAGERWPDLFAAAAAAAFGSHPKAVQLKPTDDGDYQWEHSWASVRLRSVADNPSNQVQLLPVGLAGDRRVLYASSSTTGTLLVAGLASAGVHQLLATLVVDRARRQRPDELRLVTIATAERLDPVLAELPHQLLGLLTRMTSSPWWVRSMCCATTSSIGCSMARATAPTCYLSSTS